MVDAEVWGGGRATGTELAAKSRQLTTRFVASPSSLGETFFTTLAFVSRQASLIHLQL